jgi:hypothetical protein
MIRNIAIVIMVMVCVCFAQTAKIAAGQSKTLWSPPRIDWPDSLPPATVPKQMIGALRVADMAIVLEETELEKVQKHFGGTVGSRGDAGDALGWLCLHGTDAGGPWIFWLTSSEIDGPYVSGFQWRRLSANEKPDRRCRLLPRSSGGVVLPLPIHLGTSKSEVREILGQPSFTHRNILIFNHEHPATINKDAYIVSNDVAVLFQEGKVLAIEVAHSTSN